MSEETAEAFETQISKTVGYRYLVVKPEGYDPSKSYPLIIFLHGKGEEGDDLDMVKIHGPYKKVAEMGLDVVIAAPQAPAEEWWDPDATAALTEHLLKTLPVDPDRVYVTGLSMGGLGTWRLIAERPDLFAAAAPICGWAVPKKADLIKDMPLWVFHGEKDEVVGVWNSRVMVNALKEVGAEVKYTEYPETGHDSWTETYNHAELYEWMLNQERSAPGE
ncbi:MAG: prolyl oligopeptidase family serine peptidase [Planctomycetota bacterium]